MRSKRGKNKKRRLDQSKREVYTVHSMKTNKMISQNLRLKNFQLTDRRPTKTCRSLSSKWRTTSPQLRADKNERVVIYTMSKKTLANEETLLRKHSFSTPDLFSGFAPRRLQSACSTNHIRNGVTV